MPAMNRYFFVFCALFILFSPSFVEADLIKENNSAVSSGIIDQFSAAYGQRLITDHLEGIRNSSYKNSKRLLNIRNLLVIIVILLLGILYFKWRESKFLRPLHPAYGMPSEARENTDTARNESIGDVQALPDRKLNLTGKNLLRIIAFQAIIVLIIFVGIIIYSKLH